ncbi:MAG: hypothetical protein PUC65_09155 [Clostridiales bacterium]|nr:hypothetical protein [Clostridiales bacterium]
MKLKYYLRGIAVGILFTIFVMGLTSANKKREMSDSEIIHAAKKLGMVESQASVTITGIASTPSPDASITVTPTVKPTQAATPTPAASATVMPTKEPTQTPTPTLEPTKEPTQTPIPTLEPTKVPTPTKAPDKPATTEDKEDTVTLTIVKGMYSETIAQAAHQLGLVEDPKDFNKYLINHDFASNIHIGTYKIKKGATYYEIAKAITTRSW